MLLLSAVVMLLVFFLVGIAVQRFLQGTFAVSNAVMLGFLSAQAVFHVITYPLIRLDASFSLLFWIYTGILLLLCTAGIRLLWQKTYREVLSQHIGELYSQIRREPLALLAAAGVIGLFFFVSLSYAYNTSDDSYYLPRAMEILAQNRLGISEGFAWSGLQENSFPRSVDASTLEAWKAYWSKLFNLHPTIFSRNTLSYVIHIVSVCSLYQAFSSVTAHKKGAVPGLLFLCVYFLLVLVDNHTGGIAFWTLRYPAQGKSLLCSIIYPALVYGCSQIVSCGKESIPWRKWAFISIVLTAGIASTIVGVYWPFLCCLTMGLPYLLIERRRDFVKLLPSLFLTCLPVVIYAGISYLTITTTATNYFQYDSPVWGKAISGGLNVNRLDLLLVCLMFALVCGSKTVKLVVAGGCITLLLTFANPVFIGFVSRHLTTGSVYFRLFWMVPVYFLPAYVVAELFGSCKLKSRQIAAWAISIVVVLACGVGVLRLGPNGFYRAINEKVNLNLGCERRTNPYGLEKCWDEAGSLLLEGVEEEERVRVVWLTGGDCDLRQYSERIEVIGACRDKQWKYFDQPLEEGAVAPNVLRDAFIQGNANDFSDPVWAHSQMVASKVDYLCVNIYHDFANRAQVPAGFELIYRNDSFAVYRILG